MDEGIIQQKTNDLQDAERLNAAWREVESAYTQATESFNRFLELKAAFVREFTEATNAQ